MKKKCIIWGCGTAAANLFSDSNYINNMFEVVAVADRTFDEYSDDQIVQESRFGYKCIRRTEVGNYDFDIILVTSEKFYEEIKEDIVKMGLSSEEKIKTLMMCVLDTLAEVSDIELCETYGVDIGGPSGMFYDIYRKLKQIDIVNYSKTNTWSELGNAYCLEENVGGIVIENDATCLKDIADATYDLVLSSNNLEHIANPLMAVEEWIRILKKEGLIIILVPAKEFTFDHRREVVSFQHLLEDYNNHVSESDLTHLPEILQLHDLSKDLAAGTYEEFKARSEKNFENRCLHQHVFDANVLKEIMNFFDMKVCIGDILYRGNYAIVAKK